MEREAAKRYRELAEASAASGNLEVAALFESLGREELGHVDVVEQLSRRATGHAPEAASFQWTTSEAYDTDEIEGGPARLTPYRALSIAVLNEERAFAFYSYAAAYAEDEEVARAAESFAQEELHHAALLRKHRRLAYREERVARRRRRWEVTESSPATRQALATSAAALEAAVAARHHAIAERLRGAEENEAVQVLYRVAEIARNAAAEFPGGEPIAGAPAAEPALPAAGAKDSVRDAVLDLEEVCDFYLRVADYARDEGLLNGAQRLAESAIARVALLRHWLAS